MKKLRNIALPLLASLALFACEKDYDAPLLTEPEYTGPEANITIKDLRAQTAAATQDAPVVLTQEQVLKAVVTANDESGNIFKKIYLEDATGAIEMEVDQGSVYNYYPVGQTVYIDLKGLSISVYGDEQQLGHPEGYLYRTPWKEFEKHVIRDGWANPENAKPLELDDISVINADPETYKFKLVTLKGVTFQNGGTAIFAPEDSKGQEEAITDAHGNTLVVRTSGYANFAANKLPKGKGNLTGILGRFRGNWQFTIRTAEDIKDFVEVPEEGGQGGETQPGAEKVLFQESFGKPEKNGNYWPYLTDYTGFDNPATMFENVSAEKASVRANEGSGNVWFPNGKDVTIAIKGIDVQGATTATLECQVGAGVYKEGESQDLNTLKVVCNGKELALPSKVVTGDKKEGNKPFKLVIENVAVSADTRLEFSGVAATNTYGLRLFNVKLYVPGEGGSGSGDGGNVIEPTPNE